MCCYVAPMPFVAPDDHQAPEACAVCGITLAGAREPVPSVAPTEVAPPPVPEPLPDPPAIEPDIPVPRRSPPPPAPPPPRLPPPLPDPRLLERLRTPVRLPTHHDARQADNTPCDPAHEETDSERQAPRPQRPLAPVPAAAPGTAQATVLASPDPTHNPPPPYPRLARRNAYEGRVVLLVHVSRQGRCLSVRVKESSGHRVLDDAALRAVRGWRFRPALEKGVPCEGEVEVPIRFQLTD